MKLLKLMGLCLAMAAASSTVQGATLTDLERKAVVKIEDSQTYCSAFAVTPDGYFLTALHCLRSCLQAQNLADVGANLGLGLQDLVVIHNADNLKATCADFKIKALVVPSLHLVAGGPALSLWTPEFLSSYPQQYQELVSRGWSLKTNDFLLVKVSLNQPQPCLRFSRQEVAPGGSLMSLGFPQPSQPGVQPVLTVIHGARYSHLADSHGAKAWVTQEDSNWFQASFAVPGLIYADIENSSGQSGGPLLNPQGQVIGLISGLVPSADPQGHQFHELVGVSMHHVLSQLPREIESELELKNQSCLNAL